METNTIKTGRGLFSAVASAHLQPVPRDGNLPLSYPQFHVWLDEQLPTAAASVHNVCRTLTLKGRLTTSILENALREIIRRHEILRTTYLLEEMPVQKVLPEIPFLLPRHDLTHLAVSERRRIAGNLVLMDVSRPFDLETGPLFRMKLIRLEPDEHLLVLIFHQIIIDPHSIEILFRELAELYSASACGRSSTLPPLAVQYADFALWQHQFISGNSQSLTTAWKRHLDDAMCSYAAGLDFVAPIAAQRDGAFGTQKPLGASPSRASAVQQRSIKPPLLHKIRVLDAAEGVSLHMTLLTAFKLALHHRTGASDVAVNFSAPCLRPIEARNLVGNFTSTSVLRTAISSGDTFQDLLARVRRAVDDACSTDFPAYEADLSAAKRQAPLHVLFTTVDSLESFEMGELIATPKMVFSPTTQFDLSLSISEQVDEVKCFAEHRPQLLPSAQVAQLLNQYHALLEMLLDAPTTPIQKLLERVSSADTGEPGPSEDDLRSEY